MRCLLLAALTLTPAVSAVAESGPESVFARAAAELPVRALGPALMGGRIADLAVHPTKPGTWYVGVGSGGVWKTINAGTTWTPIFDDQPSFSIGVVVLDPANPEVVWVGTGENVSGRHVSWGDGVYRSRDGGRTWQPMGLGQSQHIGRILIDPRNSNHLLVAAEGPLWSSGGERGVYRSLDGGSTWQRVLHVDEDTGATDLEFDPGNPDVVYAATYQRRRHAWGFLAGGPGSGLWKSSDAGATWRRLATGLPSGDLGKIGLAVTPADPGLVYATIEAGEADRGFYRSRDRGESWERRNSYLSGGTGPHYYQELEASPHDPDRVYQMDVFLHVTRDGGASFDYLETGHDKHSDNHALWIDPRHGDHLLVGTDGGLYESFDHGATWRHFPNLPISQLYKVALSNREPFYDVLAGAQDLGTLHGPVRTLHQDGVRNQDWYVPLGADGYGVAFDPRDPDRLFLMWQQGMLYRKDRSNEEGLMIRPQPAPGDAPERWNWDAPLRVSRHDPKRLYFGSQRLWQSDDQGDSWQPRSGDLTRGENRYELPFFGRVWSVDALHDTAAMSKYGTTTAIAESPVRAGTLVVGTDDGLIQVTTDGGANWVRASAPAGLPARAFINDVEMSEFDAATVYLVADDHKNGNFTPYVYESRDLGKSWRAIAGDLPTGAIVWAIQPDPVVPDLLFVATERGLFASPNRGQKWHELAAGVPAISFRDLQIHRRDGDLVAASFGRGLYVLDDLGPLRALAVGEPEGDGTLLPVRDAWWFVPAQLSQAAGRPELGSDDFSTPNPPHGALLTYWLRAAPTTTREARQAAEKAQREQGRDTAFPGFERLLSEALEPEPKVGLVIRDAAGRQVRWLAGPVTAGVHRVSWDLRGPSPEPVELDPPGFRPPWVQPAKGPLVAPGRYSAQLVVVSASGVRELGAPREFLVKPVPNLSPGADPVAVAGFQQRTADAARRVAALRATLGEIRQQLVHLEATLAVTPRAELSLHAELATLGRQVAEFELRLGGDPARQRLHEAAAPSLADRVDDIVGGHWDTRQNPTAVQQRDLALVEAALGPLEAEIEAFRSQDLARLRAAFAAAGAPWTTGG
ncbi:MAG: glycosyl hydrolase [Thermoanaerobaculia bacterium]|nr:glycosyl hydrolase [Thermoanaerobaculia bacterium]